MSNYPHQFDVEYGKSQPHNVSQNNLLPAPGQQSNQQGYYTAGSYHTGHQPPPNGSYGSYAAAQHQIRPSDGGVSTGLILFLVGFLLAPCWWVGACCLSAQSIRTSQDHTWRTINRVMTVLSIIGLIAVIAWYIFVLVIFNKAMDTAMSAGTSIKKT